MANGYTTTALLASIKRRAMLASNDETLSDPDLLALATEELYAEVVPVVMSVAEEFFVATEDQSIVSGTASYSIPERAMFGVLRDVLISDASVGYRSLPRVEPEGAEDLGTTGGPVGYKLEGNSVVLLPTPTGGGTLRLRYFRRPGALVQTSACGVVDASGTQDVDLLAAAPATFVNGAYLDIIKPTPGFDYRSVDNQIVGGYPGLTITFSPELTEAATPGDYVAIAGESPIPQIPWEMHPFLAQRTAVRALEALGDGRVGKAEATADRMKAQILRATQSRVKGSARVIVNRYGPGWGNRGRRYIG